MQKRKRIKKQIDQQVNGCFNRVKVFQWYGSPMLEVLSTDLFFETQRLTVHNIIDLRHISMMISRELYHSFGGSR
jgi:hypothetical protein